MITCKLLSYFFHASKKKKKKSIVSTDLVLLLDKSRKRIVLSHSDMSDSLRPRELYSLWKFSRPQPWSEWQSVNQSCPTLFDPMDYSIPGSSIHGIFQARILAWVAFPFSKRSSQPRNQTQVSHTAGRFFTS